MTVHDNKLSNERVARKYEQGRCAMNPTINVNFRLAPFGSIHVELGKTATNMEAPPASPAREPVYYLHVLNTDTWVYEVRFQTPTDMYKVPQTTQS
jgi:hypothetical protein